MFKVEPGYDIMSRNITCYILSFSIIIIFNAMNEVIQNPMSKLELGRGNNKSKKKWMVQI